VVHHRNEQRSSSRLVKAATSLGAGLLSAVLIAAAALPAPSRAGRAGISGSGPADAQPSTLNPQPSTTKKGEAPTTRLRLIIETDAGGDPDDEQSLVRFLLYANEWDVEGIIANRPRARDGENRNPERTGLGVARRLVQAYGQCYSNLVQHDSHYPTPEQLLARTVAGYSDSEEAVQLIVRAVDAPDPRPLWYSDWGSDRGAATNNLQRALDRVLCERGPAGYAKFKQRLRLSSYDNFGDHTGSLAPPFPLWVDTFRPPLEGKRWYHRFSALTATAGGFDLHRDALTGHGSLGALYPTNTGPPQKEGDTMSFLYLVPTGMNEPEHPGRGSWAGRYGLNTNYPGKNYFWANQADAWSGATNRDNTLARWAADLQNDFRARLDWCASPARQANHPPIVRVRGDTRRTVKPGDKVVLDASATRDPDGDALRFEWFVYPEAGTCDQPVTLLNADSPTVRFVAPPAAQPGELHVILTVRDTGEPPLARYARFIITVAP
jgi:hypothetical protein